MCLEARTAGMRDMMRGYLGRVNGPRPSCVMRGTFMVSPDGGGGMLKRERGWEVMMRYCSGGAIILMAARIAFVGDRPRE